MAFDTTGQFGGKLFVVERGNNRILSIDATNGDTEAFATGFVNPSGLAFGPDGGLFVAENGTATVWRISLNDIVFTSNRNVSLDAPDIYAVDPSGSRLTQLTSGPAFDTEPVWSPDRTKIAFISNRNKVDAIYVMDADGGNVTQLTNFEPGRGRKDASPAWSPDGTKIAFASNRPGSGSWDIYLTTAAPGGTETRLTTDKAADTFPAWSPDGTKIAFTSDRINKNTDIYVTTAAPGGTVTQLTTEPGSDLEPAWSPDGTTIAFSTTRAGTNNLEIYTMTATGGAQTRRTTDPGGGRSPAWSRDGTQIVFVRSLDIYTMTAEGIGPAPVTTHPRADFFPDW